MYSISFIKNNKIEKIISNGALSLYIDTLNWLDNNGYEFSGPVHDNFVKGIFNRNQLNKILSERRYLKNSMFHDINNKGKFIQISEGNVKTRIRYIKEMLINFGIDSKTIKTEGFDSTSRIKKFGEINTEEETGLTMQETPVGKIKVYKPNPFKQSICVLGDPGVGKSVTIRNILRNENHIFQIIEPTATTTGLLSQFSPSKHQYVPSRIGKLLIESSTNPNNLYTVVIDEFHKSNVIEMVNDELKHAISLKRYSGDRFILIDDATEYLKEYLEEDDGGNAMVPDNFGFIFISSKPRVISNNKDIFDRLDVVILKEENRSIDSSEKLLNLKISEEEKRKLSSSRND